MTLNTLRTALAPAVTIIFPAVAYWTRRAPLTYLDTNPVAVILRDTLKAALPDYTPERPFIDFVRDFLATHSAPMAEDFTECLARFILTGEECMERI